MKKINLNSVLCLSTEEWNRFAEWLFVVHDIDADSLGSDALHFAYRLYKVGESLCGSF